MSQKKGLDPKAYRALENGETYQPYVSSKQSLTEFTFKAIGLGVLFGVIFGSANAYLGLKVGLTISTSIPVAVMAVAVFRILAKTGIKSSILETNIAQTTGSASSSVASGVIFTLPALFLWGMAPDLLQMTLLAMCGGLLGVLFMIPLRQFLIEKEHGNLPYPEGTACAEVLVANEEGGNKAKYIFYGMGVAALFKTLTAWVKIIPAHISFNVPFIKKANIGLDLSAALFGVGYILGPRIAAIMVGGGLLSALIIIPAIAYWGDSMTAPLYPETVKLIKDMSASEIWTRYVRYIGAGAVAAAGIITLIRTIPMMIESFKMTAKHIGNSNASTERTRLDLPLKVVGIGVVIVVLVLAFVPQTFGQIGSLETRIIAAICVAVFAFFFVTVASRIVGLVGVTSNPTSGMTIAALLATASIFLLMGWTDDTGKAATLIVGCVVAIAASIAGDTSQDLKTGYLLGATPKRQQIVELIGVLTSATFVCMAVLLLADTYGFGSKELPAPQATLMKLVIDGVLEQNLPWELVGVGVAIAVVCELFKIPSLPFAVGVYLPVSTMTPIFIGGLIRHYFERKTADKKQLENRRETGVLLGSGFVGGEGLLGVAIAATAYIQGTKPSGIGTGWAGSEWMAMLAGLIGFVLLASWFFNKIKQTPAEK
ncbi:MAG: oligopeptide transporter, OPT family [Gammaproteobacteria bacterium]|nr:oligopeptide transporter, OPT family [Gammaproteobacteria bacterium]MDH5628602.1 oligopeptide transporter, OPT family [Gammaproteobacteria bacterium]